MACSIIFGCDGRRRMMSLPPNNTRTPEKVTPAPTPAPVKAQTQKSQAKTAPAAPNQNARLHNRARQVILEAAGGNDPAVRSHAYEIMAQMRDYDIPQLVRHGLADPSPAVRFAAAIAAGDLTDYAARPMLERLLRDSNPSVKLAAAYALEKLGDKRFGKWYDYVLDSDDTALVSQACILLGKLGNTSLRTDSKEKLWRILEKKNQHAPVKLQAAEALARLGDDKITRRLLAFAGSGYADDRLLAINGLELIDGPESYAMLTVLLDDPQIEVQLAAIRALGGNASDAERQLARQSVEYKDPESDDIATARVRGLAVLALGKTGLVEDETYIMQALNDNFGYVRTAAAKAAIEWLNRQADQDNISGM